MGTDQKSWLTLGRAPSATPPPLRLAPPGRRGPGSRRAARGSTAAGAGLSTASGARASSRTPKGFAGLIWGGGGVRRCPPDINVSLCPPLKSNQMDTYPWGKELESRWAEMATETRPPEVRAPGRAAAQPRPQREGSRLLAHLSAPPVPGRAPRALLDKDSMRKGTPSLIKCELKSHLGKV